MTLDEPAAARGFQYKHGDRPLEGYTIQRAAGRGGFGEVYYAVSDSGREVALKLVHTYEQIELRGISQCMNLKSPHLVTIFDVKYGEDGRPWVIMEFVSGPSLRELLDASPSGLGVAKAAFFLREIGQGLSYLHDCGIVHRDLKPGNIFYENGLVKIGDYGLSKTMSLTRHSGQTVAVGTLHYMAPEIGDGRYDRSIDIYAMGAMLFEMLTGQVPFFGSSPAEVLMKHLSSNVNLDGVEEPLKSVIRKAMAKNPNDRYQSVQEMVEAVFGSEQIRNSVSQFSPASLTMIAGRVAGGVGAGSGRRSGGTPPSGSSARSRDTGQNPRQWDRNADPWTRFASAAENIGNHVGRQFADAGERFNVRMQRKFTRRKWRYWGPSPAPSAENVLSPSDPLSLAPRIFLALAAAAVATFVGMTNVPARIAAQQGAFIFFSIIGAIVAAKLAWRFMAPGLAGESHWFRRFAIGAPVAFGAIICSFPTWIETSAARHREAVGATFLSLMLLDWSKRLSPTRKDRFNIGHVITAAICAAIVSGICEDDPDIAVVAAVAGASLAISLCSARRSLRGAIPPGSAEPIITPPPVGTAPADQTRWPSPPPIPSAFSAPPPIPPFSSSAPIYPQRAGHRSQDVSAPAIVALSMCVPVVVIAAVFHIAIFPLVFLFVIAAIIFHFKRGGRMASMTAPAGSFSGSDLSADVGGFFSGIARGVLSLAGSILLFVSLLLTLGAATNLPGLFTSGALNARMPHDLQYALGPEPDRILREIGSALAFVLGAISIAMLLATRRRGGGAHMIRVIAGALILFGAVMSLAKAMPDWADFVVLSTPGATIDWYLSHVDTHRAVVAAMIGAFGWTIFCWPRKIRPSFNPAFAGSPSAAPTPNTPPIPPPSGSATPNNTDANPK